MELVVQTYWNDITFNNSEVKSDYKSCFFKEEAFNDYEEAHALLTGPITNLRMSTDLLEELRLLFKHIDRKSNEVIFCKCVDPRCSHCTKHPIMSTQTWQFLSERGFNWFNPKPSMETPDHYLTFIEMC